MVGMLDRKLLRDAWHLRGQVFAIALVVAAGITGYCGSLSTYDSLVWLQASHYERARFAHVLAVGKRAPASLSDHLAEIPGVAETETTLAFDVLVDVPATSEPLTGRMIALPDHGLPRMNRLTLMRGAWIDAPDSNQALVNETFANAHGLKPGDRINALLNGKRESLEVVGIALSPEYIYQIREGDVLPDDLRFGVFWMGYDELAAAFNMEGAFNDAVFLLQPGAALPSYMPVTIGSVAAPAGAAQAGAGAVEARGTTTR